MQVSHFLMVAKLGQLKDENLRYPLTKYQDHTAELAKFRTLNHPKLFLAEPFKMLCKDKVWCDTSQLPKLFFSDSSHLSMSDAELLIPSIRNIIDSK